MGLIASDKAEQTATIDSQDGTEDGSIVVKSSLKEDSASQTGEVYNDPIILSKLAMKDEKGDPSTQKPTFKLDFTKVYDYQKKKYPSKHGQSNCG